MFRTYRPCNPASSASILFLSSTCCRTLSASSFIPHITPFMTEIFRSLIILARLVHVPVLYLPLPFTLTVSALSDTMTFGCWYLASFHLLTCRLYRFTLTTLFNLTLLLQGRKYNTLKNRIDKEPNFRLDQLLLGTIIETGMIFIGLTVVVLYCAYTVQAIALVLAKFVLELAVFLVVEVPIVELAQRALYPQTMPADYAIELCPDTSPSAAEGAPVKMVSRSISFGQILSQAYLMSWQRCTKHWSNSGRMLKGVASGSTILPVMRCLLYNE